MGLTDRMKEDVSINWSRAKIEAFLLGIDPIEMLDFVMA